MEKYGKTIDSMLKAPPISFEPIRIQLLFSKQNSAVCTQMTNNNFYCFDNVHKRARARDIDSIIAIAINPTVAYSQFIIFIIFAYLFNCRCCLHKCGEYSVGRLTPNDNTISRIFPCDKIPNEKSV